MADAGECFTVGLVDVEDFEFNARSAGARTQSRDLRLSGDPRTYPT